MLSPNIKELYGLAPELKFIPKKTEEYKIIEHPCVDAPHFPVRGSDFGMLAFSCVNRREQLLNMV